jgi:hypothetical protein
MAVSILAYGAYQSVWCAGLLGCGPYPKLSVQSGIARVGDSGPSTCVTTQFTAVCEVGIVGHSSGGVTLNVTYDVPQAGTYAEGAYVAFLVYSSAARYVNFTSIPFCASTYGPPGEMDALACNVPSNGNVVFRFNFTVSSAYTGSGAGSLPDSVTVQMYQVCCFP